MLSLQVDKEYHILSEFKRRAVVPVPQPLYCSTAQDKLAAGADFIILSFVEVGTKFERHASCSCQENNMHTPKHNTLTAL